MDSEQVTLQHQSLHPGMILVWKTSQPAGCQLWPLDEPPSARRDYWQTYQGVQYNWQLFGAFDATARRHFSNASLGNTYILDLAPLHLRADAHLGSRPSADHAAGSTNADEFELWKTECLHMCTPGPIDLVPQLLQHLLAAVLD